MSTTAAAVRSPGAFAEHPQVRDVNCEHQERLSQVEKICKKIADSTGAPIALFLAIILQLVLVVVGTSLGCEGRGCHSCTHRAYPADPRPT